MAGNLHTNYPPSQLELRSYQQLQGSLQLVFSEYFVHQRQCTTNRLYQNSPKGQQQRQVHRHRRVDQILRYTFLREQNQADLELNKRLHVVRSREIQLQSRQEYRCDWQDLSALQHIELQEMDSRQWRVHT